jgi:TRAP-type C4-dicarboxylate transport system permease large subunit
MRNEIIVALVMLCVSAIGSIVTRNDRKWAAAFLLAAAVAGSFASGMGIRFREIVEGPFGFIDSALSVCSASILMYLLFRTGLLEALFSRICRIGNRTLKSFSVLLFIALPAMFTGFAGLSIVTTGAIAGKALRKGGASDARTAGIVASGSLIGMVLPPNCIPAMIASNGAGSVLPTPYVGFFLPLIVLALPALIASAFLFSKTIFLAISDGCEAPLSKPNLIVLAAVMAATLVEGLFSSYVYIGGNALAFTAASIIVLIINRKIWSPRQALDEVTDALLQCIGPVALMLALGSFIEVSSMTGVRGLYSLWILPMSTQNVMLALMAASLAIGFFLGEPIPAVLAAYAVFPIGWLANDVIVAGVASALAVVSLLSWKGGITESVCKALSIQGLAHVQVLKQSWLTAALILAMGIVMVVFGNSLEFLVL